MFEFFTQALWSPYIAGAGIGILTALRSCCQTGLWGAPRRLSRHGE